VSFAVKWTRRSITIPAYHLAFVFVLAGLPIFMTITLICDAFVRKNFSVTRSLLFLLVYLGSELLGMFLCFCVWLYSGVWMGVGKKRFVEGTFYLQRLWARILFTGARIVFGLRLDVEGMENIKGSILLFLRHASLPDVILTPALFIIPKRKRIRHIIKSELLWDPCLDIGGNRVPTIFVKRGSQDSEREIDKVRWLMKDLPESEGVMIYPEGTRFSQKKKEHILQKLKEKGDAFMLESARSLKHLLPPRLGGFMAMLEENKKSAAVFCGHVGFEKVHKAVDFVNGTLVNAVIKVKLWTVPFEKIPLTAKERIHWFMEQWQIMDDWIEEQMNGPVVLEKAS